MMFPNKLTKLLQIKYPIIQAPMAGGVTTTELVASVSNNGCLGMIGAGYMSPVELRKQIKEVRQLTSNNFGVNMFIPNNFLVSGREIENANLLLEPFRHLLEIEGNGVDLPTFENLQATYTEQWKIVLEEKVPVCSFTFGVPSEHVLKELKQHNIVLVGTATTVREAIEIEKIGMDIVVVQGSEAGGHRGNFISVHTDSLIGLMSLIPQVADNVKIPVVAAGGIMDGRGLMASICLGAQGVQMGTAFLTCEESGAHPIHKQAILQSSEDQTVLTRAFSGKWARGIRNKFVDEMRGQEKLLPDFPIQNSLTKWIRKASSTQNNQAYMSLWSGQSPRLAKNQTVASLITSVIDECKRF